MSFRSVGLVGAGLVAVTGTAGALDVGVTSKKLVVVDKGSQAKIVYVSKDTSGAITKGADTSLDAIEVVVTIAYDNGSAAGTFVLPAGASDGTSGWVTNKVTTAKYVNKDAPGGPTQAKVGVIKPSKLLKLVAKGLGDDPLEVASVGFPPAVRTSYCVTNGAEETCHCSLFGECNGTVIAQGTGRKLVCRNGVAAACETGGCVPDCAGKQCGPDGCAGTCGFCPGGETCLDDGICSGCTPDCAGKECGDDGCGGNCGSCSAPFTCDESNQCTCTPDCAGRECGTDGCFGSCGTCDPGDICVDGQCEPCVPDCAGKTCGPDGCGGSCGTCAPADSCIDGQCEACVPDCAGKTCGPDGCGGSCGTCAGDEFCTDDGLCE